MARAVSLNCPLIKQSHSTSSDSFRVPKIINEYKSHAARKEYFRDEEETHGELAIEVQELKKMIGETQNKFETLRKGNKKQNNAKSYSFIEKKLMRLQEILMERRIERLNIDKIKLFDDYYKNKCLILETTDKRLKQRYADLKTDYLNAKYSLKVLDQEKSSTLSNIFHLKKENEKLKQEISEASGKCLNNSNLKPKPKVKVFKSHSTNAFFNPNISKIKINKDLIISPSSNASLPTVTQYSIRRDSVDKDNSRILRGLPTSQSRCVSKKTYKHHK